VARAALIVLLVAAIAAIGGFLWWAQPQPLLPEATAALASTPAATFEEADDGRLTYTPTAAPPRVGLVLYPGGKVPPAAYAPAARAIAEQGYLVAIVPVPFNLAILSTGAAKAAIDDHPEIASWVVGGHSLGGASAALFVDANPGTVDGLVLWAAYSSVDLADDGLLVSLGYGTLDASVASYTDPTNLAKLGPAVAPTVIDGGNHEQMGWYTGQPNDPPATISREAQQDEIVAATVELLAALDATPLE
jgi:hypothetical protein